MEPNAHKLLTKRGTNAYKLLEWEVTQSRYFLMGATGLKGIQSKVNGLPSPKIEFQELCGTAT
jgi:hypothetical protein